MNWEVGDMSRTAKITLIFLTAFNVIALIIDFSLPTKAAVGGKTYEGYKPIKISCALCNL
jgi:hypothetical protein